MFGRKKRGEPEYEWVEKLSIKELEELANRLIKSKGEFTDKEIKKVIKKVCKKNKKLAADLVRKYRDQIENLDRDFVEETAKDTSDTDSLGSLDGDQEESSEVSDRAVVTDQRSRVARRTTQGESIEEADQRERRSDSTEPDFLGFGTFFDSIQSPSDLVKLVDVSTPDLEKHLSNTESGVREESKVEKKFKFPLALSGLAHRYYKALVADRKERDYEQLKAAFEKRYLKNKEKIMNKINSRMMGENEEIEDYYSEMVELCYEADELMSKGQIVRNIVNGVPNEYKRYMHPGDIQTLEQLQEKIESATTSITLEKNTEHRARIRDMEKLTKKMENIKLGKKDEVKSELFNELEKIILEKKEKGKVNKIAEKKGKKDNDKKGKKDKVNFVKNSDNNNRNFRK